MELTLPALAPAVPTSLKVGINFMMFALAFGLATSFGKRRVSKPVVGLFFLSISVASVAALDFSFPDNISRGLDGRGLLAALIGLLAGSQSVLWATTSTHQR